MVQSLSLPQHIVVIESFEIVSKLNEEHLLTLAELVARRLDSTLEELRLQLRLETKVEVSISTIWRGLERIEFNQKKDQAHARG